MRKKIFLLLILNFQFSILNSQEYLWPIQRVGNNNESATSIKSKQLDILYRPQEYIGKEHNFADLFLTAPEGTTIVAPVDGKIIFAGYVYCFSHDDHCSFDDDSEEFKKNMKNTLELIASEQSSLKKMNAKFLSFSLGIETADGRKVWISGLHHDVSFLLKNKTP